MSKIKNFFSQISPSTAAYVHISVIFASTMASCYLMHEPVRPINGSLGRLESNISGLSESVNNTNYDMNKPNGYSAKLDAFSESIRISENVKSEQDEVFMKIAKSAVDNMEKSNDQLRLALVSLDKSLNQLNKK